MRLKEIETKTPQQLRIDALKRNAETIQQTQQRLNKLKSVT